MIPFVLLILTISSGNAQNISAFPRIIGGYEANIENYPFIVSIQVLKIHRCGGAIIKPDYIVTAAHCVPPNFRLEYKVIAGTDDLLKGGVERTVTNIKIHPNYDRKRLNNDVAVVKLNAKLEYIQRKIHSIELPELSDSVPLLWGTVMGWGKTHNNKEKWNNLRAVDLEVYRSENCIFFGNAKVQFCAGHDGRKDSCEGDSGGPFVINNILYGIVSYGNCGSGSSPGVYTKIPALVDWIKDTADFTA